MSTLSPQDRANTRAWETQDIALAAALATAGVPLQSALPGIIASFDGRDATTTWRLAETTACGHHRTADLAPAALPGKSGQPGPAENLENLLTETLEGVRRGDSPNTTLERLALALRHLPACWAQSAAAGIANHRRLLAATRATPPTLATKKGKGYAIFRADAPRETRHKLLDR